MSIYVPVLLGSSRIGRRSVHVANFVVKTLGERLGVATELLDLAKFNFPCMERRLEEMLDPPSLLTNLHDQLCKADGLIIVSPEYKNGYPGVLKNALDYLEAGVFEGKPVGIVTVSSGGFGGLNCLAQLRLVCLAMGGLPIPATFPISRVQAAFSETGALVDVALKPKLESFIDELIWYTEAIVHHRETKRR